MSLLSNAIADFESLLGTNPSLATQALVPLSMIKAGVNVGGNAQTLAALLASHNPAASATAAAIAANPSVAPALVGTLESEINA